MLSEGQTWKLDCCYQFAGSERCLNLRMIPGKKVQVGEGDVSLPLGARDVHQCIKRRESNTHIRRVSSDTRRRCAQDRVDPIEAFDGVTTLARISLVASRSIVIVEVRATGSL
jgi:hypothetical protein